MKCNHVWGALSAHSLYKPSSIEIIYRAAVHTSGKKLLDIVEEKKGKQEQNHMRVFISSLDIFLHFMLKLTEQEVRDLWLLS